MAEKPRYDIIRNFLAHQILARTAELERMPISNIYDPNQAQHEGNMEKAVSYICDLYTTLEYVNQLERVYNEKTS